VPFRDLLAKFVLYQVHKTIGMTAFLVAAAMVLLRLRVGRPDWSPGMTRWHRHLAASVHLVLVVLLLLTASVGYLAASAAPIHIPTLYFGVIRFPDVVDPDAALFAILRQAHRALAMSLILVACAHGAAAVVHHLRGNDALRRMKG
jgi:cytochrome b561